MQQRDVSSKFAAVSIIFFWSVAILLSLGWNIYLLNRSVQEQAHSQADAAIQKDLAYRKLVSRAGGVYVTTASGIKPNPYLAHLDHRDITTTDNIKLTLINSSYLVRLVHDIEAELGSKGLRGHVTSEHPLRLQNSPDDWELQALRQLKEKGPEKPDAVHTQNDDFYRLMRPRYAQSSCFSCHTDGYYKVGDVMGGISVSVPLGPLVAKRNNHIITLSTGHMLMWLFGIIIVLFGYRHVKRKEVDLEYSAYHDALTHLPNRKYFLESLDSELMQAQKSGQHGAVLLFDLDRFKNINDSLGHPAGDTILQITAQRLKREMRDVDLAARLGGDEFIVMLPGLGLDPEIAYSRSSSIAKRIQKSLCQAYHVQDSELHITPSIGIAIYPEQGESSDDILKHADAAMYESKSSGRNQVSLFSPSMQMKADERLELEKELRSAIAGEQLTLHYQPQLTCNNRIVGFEALVRWPHPIHGMIPPSKFISVAEESGLIFSLGEWVLATATAQTSKWSAMELLPQDATIAINVSAHQFHRPEFTELAKNILHTAQVDPHHIKLELTESVIVDDVPGTITRMNELQQIGVQFALDDFGTGYSSLSYLRQLPINQLKIDQSFIQHISHNHEDKAIAETIIGMSQSLKMDIIAEGVEQEEQLKILQELGCDTYQGYLYSPAVSAGEATVMLQSQSCRSVNIFTKREQ